MNEKKSVRLLMVGTSLAYTLIALEVLFMITPFALYFYGAYGPVLDFLSSRRATAWTTEFFLPHMVFISDPLLVGLSYLQALFVLGLLLFLLAAAPLYWGRLTKKKVVSSGFYARIRHPQYLFLAVSGLGLLLYWPRFIVLIFYVTMLFVYYLLAVNEEWRMLGEHPEGYREYMARTWMFLPGAPGGKLYAALFGRVGAKWLGLTAAYLLVMGLSVWTAFGLRAYTVAHLPLARVGEMSLVSVFPRPEEDLRALYAKTLESAEVRRYLDGPSIRLAYVMPGDFFLTGLILEEGPRFTPQQMERYPELRNWAEKTKQGGLVKFFRVGYKFFRTIGTTRRVYDFERIVFVAASDLEGRPVAAAAVLGVGVRRTPALIVDIDSETRQIISVSAASGENAWGRLPMPNI